MTPPNVIKVSDPDRVLAAVRTGTQRYATNFFVAPQHRAPWFNSRVLWLVVRDDLAVFCREEEACWRIFFSGARDALANALASMAFTGNGKPLALDLIGRPADTTDLVAAAGKAGFHPHRRLQRLTRGVAPVPVEDGWTTGPMEPDDVASLVFMLHKDFDAVADQLPDHGELMAAMATGQVRVARDGHSVSGFLWAERTGVTVLIRYLCVDAAKRGTGFGGSLMRGYFREMAGCTRHLLWLRDNNRSAAACYGHYGYAPDGLEDQIMKRDEVKYE
jgi:hypothetical protein